MEVKGDGTAICLIIEADWVATGVAQCSLFFWRFLFLEIRTSHSLQPTTLLTSREPEPCWEATSDVSFLVKQHQAVEVRLGSICHHISGGRKRAVPPAL